MKSDNSEIEDSVIQDFEENDSDVDFDYNPHPIQEEL